MADSVSMLRTLLGLAEGAEKEILEFVLESARVYALGYCRLDALPVELESVVVRMAAELYRAEDYGVNDIPQRVKAIAQGERSVTYEAVNGGVFQDYEKLLKPFINRKGRVPSELL